MVEAIAILMLCARIRKRMILFGVKIQTSAKATRIMIKHKFYREVTSSCKYPEYLAAVHEAYVSISHHFKLFFKETYLSHKMRSKHAILLYKFCTGVYCKLHRYQAYFVISFQR